MSFQAYLDNIQEKTGKTPEDFKRLAEKKGLLKAAVKAMEIVNWLKRDFGLGHGHAMAIYAVLKSEGEPETSKDERIEEHLSRGKSAWRKSFDSLMGKLKKFGGDVSVDPTASYLSILKGKKKFAIVQISARRMDIGIKLKGVDATKRFQKAGAWNAMVTHRVQIENPGQMDQELIKWLREAYDQN